MGTGEMGTPTKTTKASTAQEQTPSGTAVIYPDWAATFQAYYNSGTTPLPPPGYFHSAVASSPQAHPYVWGAQPLMPPYGTPPPPYVAMYHGGMYTHPSMPPGAHPYGPYGMSSPGGTAEVAASAMPAGAEAEGKSSEAKDQSPPKKSRGSLGSLNMLTGKANESGKGTQGSANGVFSQSGESGSEGSSEGSDEISPNGSQSAQKPGLDQGSMDTDEALNGNATSHSVQGGSVHAASEYQAANMNMSPSMTAVAISVASTSGTVAGPTTNLNIGMDYWSGPAPTPISTTRGKRPAAATTASVVPAGQSLPVVGPRDGVPPELWLQDERELKRQRRKQSNRESARRSRLRKQAECEELAHRVETLKEENMALRTELHHLREECKKLSSENASLNEQLQKGDGEEPGDIRAEKNELQIANTEQHKQLNNDSKSSAKESMKREP